MKTMTCKQLGGACNRKFHANSFEEITGLSKEHGIEMLRQGDKEHLTAMEKIKELRNSPEKMKAWYKTKQKEFDSLPDKADQ